MRVDTEKMDLWLTFDGHYEKHEADIQLKDGTIVNCVWPNAGVFNELHGEKRTISSEDIAKIKYHDYFSEELKAKLPVSVAIQGKILTNNDIGSKVTYIPFHAHGNASHPDCDSGVIVDWNAKGVMVNYVKNTCRTKPEDLIWG